MSTLPPLKALFCLDAAVRHNSFSLAAQELHVTPGAVGQQIQKLEEWLGISLFTRHTRQVYPTAEGQAYWKKIQPALAQIAQASWQLKRRDDKKVWLSMPPSFAAKWFPRRMSRFLTRHPETELHLNASSQFVDFEHNDIDLAIRYFNGKDPALEVTLLYADEARLYCAPQYARAMGLKHARRFADVTVLNTTQYPHWKNWLSEATPLTTEQLERIPVIHFDQNIMAIEAAKQGQGVVISSPILVEEDIRAGLLVEPIAAALELSSGYYVVHHKKHPLRPAAASLKAWLIEEAQMPTKGNIHV